MANPVQQIGPGSSWRRLRWKPSGPVDAVARLALAAPLGLALIAVSGIGHRWFDILAQFTAPTLIATAILTALIALTRLKMAAQ